MRDCETWIEKSIFFAETRPSLLPSRPCRSKYSKSTGILVKQQDCALSLWAQVRSILTIILLLAVRTTIQIGQVLLLCDEIASLKAAAMVSGKAAVLELTAGVVCQRVRLC